MSSIKEIKQNKEDLIYCVNKLKETIKEYQHFNTNGLIDSINNIINSDYFLFFTDNNEKKDILKDFKKMIDYIHQNESLEFSDYYLLLNVKERIQDLNNLKLNFDYSLLERYNGKNICNYFYKLNDLIKEFILNDYTNDNDTNKKLKSKIDKLFEKTQNVDYYKDELTTIKHLLSKLISNSKLVDELKDIRQEFKKLKEFIDKKIDDYSFDNVTNLNDR